MILINTTNNNVADDDDSCSSTVGVLALTKPQSTSSASTVVDDASTAVAPQTNRMERRLSNPCLQAVNSHRIKKTVRFDETANISYDNNQRHDQDNPEAAEPLCKEDCKPLWYTARDIHDMKACNKMLAAQIARSEQRSLHSDPYSYQRIMYRTYEACCRYEADRAMQQQQQQSNNKFQLVSTVVDSVNMEEEDDPTILLDTQDEQQLRQWLDVAVARLGLERTAVRDIARDRYYRYKDLVKNVLDVQEQMEACAVEPSAETKAEYLRQCCRAISRPSQIFARQLARAQAATSSLH